MKKEGLNTENEVTIEDVKAIEAFKNLSNEQLMEIINVIKTFRGIIYSLYKRELDGEMDLEENIIALNNTEDEFKNAA